MAKTRKFSLVVSAFVLLISLFLMNIHFAHSASVDSKYRVFCANNKIEVEQRTLEQQKNARGSNVCVLGEFDYLSDADKFAEGKGGKGSECKCP